MNTVKIPAKKQTVELVIKKSRFIATVEPLSDYKGVKERVREIRNAHPGCSHVVYAFFANDDRSQSGMSDDGEPHGTAGRPVYEVLKGCGLTDILLTVTRYFGGTKLGTGGLVSAYGQSAKNALDALPVVEKIYTIKVRLVFGYDFYDKIKKMLTELGALEIEEDFATQIHLSAKIPQEIKESFLQTISDISRGSIKPEFLEKGLA